MSQYILPLFAFAVNNGNQFLINSNIYNVDTRHSSNLHLSSANLGICQKGVYLSGIRFLIDFLSTLKNLPLIWGHLKAL
jgi:hypothetical protein